MKNFNSSLSVLLVILFQLLAGTLRGQLDFLPRSSQAATLSQRIGITDLTIQYSRPSVSGREVWGGLVPYGMKYLGGEAPESPWRAGANENTVFIASHDVEIEGKMLSAGKYGLHMVVHENDRATIIFSNNYWSWGSYVYNPAEDALRVEVNTKEVSHVEQLTYTFDEVNTNAVIASLNWGNKQIPFRIGVNVTQIVLTEIRHQLQTLPGYSRQSWEQAASYALYNGGDLKEAMDWVNIAIKGRFFSEKNFNNLQIKSQILEKQGNIAEARLIMDEAIQLGTAQQLYNYGRLLIAQNKSNEALRLFKWNAKNHRESWLGHYGLARGFSAVGELKTALKHLRIAKEKAPDERNKKNIAKNIALLEQGTDFN